MMQPSGPMTPVDSTTDESASGTGPSGPMTPVSAGPSGPMTPVAQQATPKFNPREGGYQGPKGFYDENTHGVNTEADLNTNWQAGKGGVRSGFRNLANSLASQYHLGIFDFNAGHGDPNHLGSADPHLSGRAMDVDTINGETVGGALTPGIARFIVSTLSKPGTRVGLGGDLYKYFAKMPQYQGRVFSDAPTHVHVEVTPEMESYYESHGTAPQTAMTPIKPKDFWSAAKAIASPKPQPMTPAEAIIANPYLGPRVQEAGVGTAIAGAWNALDRIGKDAEEFNGRVMHYPLEGMDAILGAAQRFNAGMSTTAIKDQQAAAAQHANPAQAAFGSLIHSHMQGLYDAFHPNDMPRQAQVVQDTLSMLHLPTNDTNPWRRAGEVFLAQTVTDPLSMFPWMKGIAETAKVPGAMRAIEAGIGPGKDVGFLRGLAGQTATDAVARGSNWAKSLWDWQRKVFAANPHWDGLLDGKGRGMVTGLLNRIGQDLEPVAKADEQLLKDGANVLENAHSFDFAKPVVQRILQEGYVYGDNHMRTMAQAMGYEPTAAEMAKPAQSLVSYDVQQQYRNLVAAARSEGSNVVDLLTKHLDDSRKAVGNAMFNSEAQHVLEKYGGWIGDGPIDVAKLNNKGVTGAITSFLNQSPLKVLGQLGKESVMANPLPHILKNMGILQYLRGGLPAVGKALAYTVRGIPEETAQRLAAMGEKAPDYLHDMTGPWEKMPIIGKATTTWVSWMQQFMGRMEGSYRAALLDHLDKEVGPSLHMGDELQKGQMIRDALGDYKNVSAFVTGLQAMGGPFVAFRAGIVPKAVYQAVLRDPQRVEGLVRLQKQIEDNIGVELGGPISDFARMMPMANPVGFLTSPSTMGIVGSGIQYLLSIRQGYPESPKELMGQAAQQYSGPISMVYSALGVPFAAPGKQMGQFDLQSALLGLMGWYSSQGWSPRAERAFDAHVEKN